ncbi:MAG: type II secretion system secretin GspD [Dissulfurispiraceae bacterium]
MKTSIKWCPDSMKNSRSPLVFHIMFVIVFAIFLTAVILCPSPLLMASTSKELPANQKVTFNFVDVELPTVAKFISEITGKNFIFDDRVKGKITIIAPTKLNIDDAFNLFTSVLELKGFTIVPSGVDAYKIIPSSEVRQRGIEISKDKRPVNESYIARLILLQHISADDVLKFVQPMVSKDGYVSAFGPGNMLLVIDAGLNVEKILSIVDIIDQPSLKEAPEIVFLKYAAADTISKIVNEGFARAKIGAGAVSSAPSSSDIAKAVADQRLNAIVLFGDTGVRGSMKSIIGLLDVPAPEAQGRINVYFLENADATDLAKIIDGVIKGTQSQHQAAPGAAPVTPFEAAGGITITADKASNALIIVASPSDYYNLSQIIKQLDKRRRQVYVEAMIVEASVEKLRQVGVQWRVSAQSNGAPVAIGGFGTIDNTALQSILTGLQGVSVGGAGNFLNVPVSTVGSDGTVVTSTLSIPGFAALFSLNDFRDVVNVLSTPQILTSDNKEAQILVGENVPFISQSETGVATGTAVLNAIQRQDIGIILRLTPQITEGDHVKLDIYEEISAIQADTSTNFVVTTTVGPTITKRSTKTSVVVKDNQTVVIGGLMQESQETSETKVPFLGDIPGLGLLFRSKSVTKTKTNLIVFLNPHIIKESQQLVELSRVKDREFEVAAHRFAEGELLVKFKEGISDETAKEIIAKKKASVIRFIEGTKVYEIRLKENQDVEDAVKEFSKVPEVEYAEPNYKREIQ